MLNPFQNLIFSLILVVLQVIIYGYGTKRILSSANLNTNFSIILGFILGPIWMTISLIRANHFNLKNIKLIVLRFIGYSIGITVLFELISGGSQYDEVISGRMGAWAFFPFIVWFFFIPVTLVGEKFFRIKNFIIFLAKLFLFIIIFITLQVVVFATAQASGYYDFFGRVGAFPAIASLFCIAISYSAVKGIFENEKTIFYIENFLNFSFRFFDDDYIARHNKKETDRISKLKSNNHKSKTKS